MKKISNVFLLVIATSVCFYTCKTGELKTTGINTSLNKAYKQSIQIDKGKFTVEEYKQIKSEFERELNVEISNSKSILINYDQYGKNCRLMHFDKSTKQGVVQNIIDISTRISGTYNAVDFLIYHDSSFFKEFYPAIKNVKLDSGYFYSTIFTERSNCSGFFIVKPNGEYLKYYGFDYFSKVTEFLEKN